MISVSSKWTWITSLAILLALLFMSLPVFGVESTTTVLVVGHAHDGEPIDVYDVEDGDQFEIRYVHSFEGTPIHERYEVDGTSIVQVEERFKYHASGLEHDRDRYRDGDWMVAELEEEHESFVVRVARSTDQRLVIDGTERSLDSYADPGEPIELSVEERSRIEHELLSR